MPTYESSPAFDQLLAEFKAATEADAKATRALHDALVARLDSKTLLLLTEVMEQAHNAKMDVFDRMQRHRLDKA